MLRAFKRAQAATSLSVIEGALASADQGRLSQISDLSAALLERELSGSALSMARRRFRASIFTSPTGGLAIPLGVTQSAAGAGAATALCKTGVGMAKPIPPGAKGVIIEEVITLRQQGLSYKQIADKFGWTWGGGKSSTNKVYSIVKRYAPQLLGEGKTLATGVPGTLPKPAPPVVPKPAPGLRSVNVDRSGFQNLARSEWMRLDTASRKAVRAYKSSGFARINTYLRKGTTPTWYTETKLATLKRRIKRISESFFRLENDLTVWRGGWETSVKVGDVFADKAFVSTSLSREKATSFLSPGEGLWKIKVPRDARVALPCCENIGELEVLLARGSKVRVTSVTADIGGVVIEAVLIV